MINLKGRKKREEDRTNWKQITQKTDLSTNTQIIPLNISKSNTVLSDWREKNNQVLFQETHSK